MPHRKLTEIYLKTTIPPAYYEKMLEEFIGRDRNVVRPKYHKRYDDFVNGKISGIGAAVQSIFNVSHFTGISQETLGFSHCKHEVHNRYGFKYIKGIYDTLRFTDRDCEQWNIVVLMNNIPFDLIIHIAAHCEPAMIEWPDVLLDYFDLLRLNGKVENCIDIQPHLRILVEMGHTNSWLTMIYNQIDRLWYQQQQTVFSYFQQGRKDTGLGRVWPDQIERRIYGPMGRSA